MIIDNETNYAVATAYGTATGDEVDLGSAAPGPGNPVKCFVQGDGLTGATGFTISHGDTSGSLTVLETHTTTDIVDDLVEFELPSNIKRYTNITITGTLSAGTWSAGVILPGAQTAK